jgi:hypothetical protein
MLPSRMVKALAQVRETGKVLLMQPQQKEKLAGRWWLTPVTLATQEAEIRITV